MTNPIAAKSLVVENCDEDCSCQACHIGFLDADEELFAIASTSPALARTIARDLLAAADLAEARTVKQRGVLV